MPGNVDKKTQRPPLAVFDLDGTLTTSDTLLPFALSFAKDRWKLLAMASLPFVLAGYTCRMISDSRAKNCVLSLFFGGEPTQRVVEYADRFFEKWLVHNTHPVGHRRLCHHQRRGDRIILLSASPDLYVPVIARRFGIEEVICTRVRSKNGRSTGAIDGKNCKGDEKVRVLKEYIGNEISPDRSFGYGDSRADLPFLRWVQNGFLVHKHGVHPVTKDVETASS